MEKTLYEVLELSRRAGPEAIEGAYHRLREKYAALQNEKPDDLDVQNAIKAIQESYRLLSTPTRKERYDVYLESIDPLPLEIIIKPFWSPIKIASGIMFLILLSLGYYNYRLDVAEKERQIAAEARAREEARAQAESLIAEQEKAKLEQQQLYERRSQELIAKFETERARMEGQQIVRQETQFEEYARQQAQRQAQQAAATAQRQSIAERQRYESQRRLEEQQARMEQARQQSQYRQQTLMQQTYTMDQREQEKRINEAKLNSIKAAQ